MRQFLDVPTYAERVQQLPCVVCRRTVGHVYGPSECAHLKHRGMGGKDVPLEGNSVPLCHAHHTGGVDRNGKQVVAFHRAGVRSFQAHYGIDLQAEAARVRRHIKATDA
jgi:hypothetical protein